MKCSYCNTETSNQNQVICEYCGNELSKNEPSRIISPGTKINQFLEDTGLRDLYQKIKKSLKE
jgi:predicted amidophosphoribosyltransferase